MSAKRALLRVRLPAERAAARESAVDHNVAQQQADRVQEQVRGERCDREPQAAPCRFPVQVLSQEWDAPPASRAALGQIGLVK